ncbi:2,3-diaminopropionate biosynthesis protein SbnA [Labedaea rhizosphaerae]|uniref:N-(2-amino-2-carboxyethyl)-L-glutamate synthase n=1 Tax=Labedaea rhizosphaerae TaxID=598644 RepID=A0A4R6SC41_LABRH|nr:2,3-diaminopropionate biosynthesis protein SbnA [Labedaea rhizosphaerae]TDP96485.1 cysteine synthase A [Labedaea rhizosphaerae]
MTSTAPPLSSSYEISRPRKFHPDIVSAIGDTPLIALDRLFDPRKFRVFGKCERFNPAGSIKDRAALSMITRALDDGDLIPGVSTVVESTSGNLGIALAQICNFYGLDLILVTDPKVTAQNAALMRAYGARVELIDQRDPETGEYLPMRLRRVRELLGTTPHAWWPDQYGNLGNPAAHHATMGEIVASLAGEIDYLFLAAGTCGTLRGCAEYIQGNGLPITVVAVDSVNSAIFGEPAAWEHGHTRRIPGHGAAVAPALLRDGLADRVIKVTDAECVAGCRALLATESILAGGSSGAVISALRRSASWIEPGSTCVALLPDGGDRYLDTIYSDAWVAENIEDFVNLDDLDDIEEISETDKPDTVAA